MLEEDPVTDEGGGNTGSAVSAVTEFSAMFVNELLSTTGGSASQGAGMMQYAEQQGGGEDVEGNKRRSMPPSRPRSRGGGEEQHRRQMSLPFEKASSLSTKQLEKLLVMQAKKIPMQQWEIDALVDSCREKKCVDKGLAVVYEFAGHIDRTHSLMRKRTRVVQALLGKLGDGSGEMEAAVLISSLEEVAVCNAQALFELSAWRRLQCTPKPLLVENSMLQSSSSMGAAALEGTETDVSPELLSPSPTRAAAAAAAASARPTIQAALREEASRLLAAIQVSSQHLFILQGLSPIHLAILLSPKFTFPQSEDAGYFEKASQAQAGYQGEVLAQVFVAMRNILFIEDGIASTFRNFHPSNALQATSTSVYDSLPLLRLTYKGLVFTDAFNWYGETIEVYKTSGEVLLGSLSIDLSIQELPNDESNSSSNAFGLEGEGEREATKNVEVEAKAKQEQQAKIPSTAPASTKGGVRSSSPSSGKQRKPPDSLLGPPSTEPVSAPKKSSAAAAASPKGSNNSSNKADEKPLVSPQDKEATKSSKSSKKATSPPPHQNAEEQAKKAEEIGMAVRAEEKLKAEALAEKKRILEEQRQKRTDELAAAEEANAEKKRAAADEKAKQAAALALSKQMEKEEAVKASALAAEQKRIEREEKLKALREEAERKRLEKEEKSRLAAEDMEKRQLEKEAKSRAAMEIAEKKRLENAAAMEKRRLEKEEKDKKALEATEAKRKEKEEKLASKAAEVSVVSSSPVIKDKGRKSIASSSAKSQHSQSSSSLKIKEEETHSRPQTADAVPSQVEGVLHSTLEASASSSKSESAKSLKSTTAPDADAASTTNSGATTTDVKHRERSITLPVQSTSHHAAPHASLAVHAAKHQQKKQQQQSSSSSKKTHSHDTEDADSVGDDEVIYQAKPSIVSRHLHGNASRFEPEEDYDRPGSGKSGATRVMSPHQKIRQQLVSSRSSSSANRQRSLSSSDFHEHSFLNTSSSPPALSQKRYNSPSHGRGRFSSKSLENMSIYASLLKPFTRAEALAESQTLQISLRNLEVDGGTLVELAARKITLWWRHCLKYYKPQRNFKKRMSSKIVTRDIVWSIADRAVMKSLQKKQKRYKLLRNGAALTIQRAFCPWLFDKKTGRRKPRAKKLPLASTPSFTNTAEGQSNTKDNAKSVPLKRKLTSKDKAALVIQCIIRIFIAKRRVQNKRKETSIKKGKKMSVLLAAKRDPGEDKRKKNLQIMFKAATRIQAVFRSRKARNRVLTIVRANMLLIDIWRKFVAFRNLKSQLRRLDRPLKLTIRGLRGLPAVAGTCETIKCRVSVYWSGLLHIINSEDHGTITGGHLPQWTATSEEKVPVKQPIEMDLQADLESKFAHSSLASQQAAAAPAPTFKEAINEEEEEENEGEEQEGNSDSDSSSSSSSSSSDSDQDSNDASEDSSAISRRAMERERKLELKQIKIAKKAEAKRKFALQAEKKRLAEENKVKEEMLRVKKAAEELIAKKMAAMAELEAAKQREAGKSAKAALGSVFGPIRRTILSSLGMQESESGAGRKLAPMDGKCMVIFGDSFKVPGCHGNCIIRFDFLDGERKVATSTFEMGSADRLMFWGGEYSRPIKVIMQQRAKAISRGSSAKAAPPAAETEAPATFEFRLEGGRPLRTKCGWVRILIEGTGPVSQQNRLNEGFINTMFAKWQRRYFSLDGEELSVYSQRSDTTPLFVVRTKNFSHFEVKQGDSIKDTKSTTIVEDLHNILLYTKQNDTIFIRCNDSGSRVQWSECFNVCINGSTFTSKKTKSSSLEKANSMDSSVLNLRSTFVSGLRNFSKLTGLAATPSESMIQGVAAGASENDIKEAKEPKEKAAVGGIVATPLASIAGAIGVAPKKKPNMNRRGSAMIRNVVGKSLIEATHEQLRAGTGDGPVKEGRSNSTLPGLDSDALMKLQMFAAEHGH